MLEVLFKNFKYWKFQCHFVIFKVESQLLNKLITNFRLKTGLSTTRKTENLKTKFGKLKTLILKIKNLIFEAKKIEFRKNGFKGNPNH